MTRAKLFLTVCLILIISAGCSLACSNKTQQESHCKKGDDNEKARPVEPVEKVLKKLKEKTENLISYQADVEYLFRQPMLFDSKTLRKGALYYGRYDNKSKLRVNFNTLKQDEAKQKDYKEQFIFDGVWLTHIDYQIEQVRRKQLSQPNEPVNAFELAARNFPIVGFSNVEELKQQFRIELIEPSENKEKFSTVLRLQVKPQSLFREDYETVECRLDKKARLPAKIITKTPEGDIYEIALLKPKVNEKLDKEIFSFVIPKGFTVETLPLKEQRPPEPSGK